MGFKGLKSHGRKRFPENEIGLRIAKDVNRTSDEVKYPRNSEYKRVFPQHKTAAQSKLFS